MGGSYSVISADEILENLATAYKEKKDMKKAISKAKDDLQNVEKEEDKQRVEMKIREYEIMPVVAQPARRVVESKIKDDVYSFTLKMTNQETRVKEDVAFDIQRSAVLNQQQSPESRQYLPVIEECLQKGNMCSMFDDGKLCVCVDVYGDDLTVNYCTETDEEFKANMLVRSRIPENFLKTLFFERYYAITIENVTINRNKKGSVTFYVHTPEYLESKVTEVKDIDDLVRLVENGEITDEQTAVKSMLRVWGEYIILNTMLIVNGIVAAVFIKKFIFSSGYLFAVVEIKKADQIFDTPTEYPVDTDLFINNMIDFLQQLIDQFEEDSDSCVDTDAVVQQFEEARVFEEIDSDRKDAAYNQLTVCFEALCDMNRKFFGSSKLEIKEALQQEIIPKILENLKNETGNVAVRKEGAFTKVVSPLAENNRQENEEEEIYDNDNIVDFEQA